MLNWSPSGLAKVPQLQWGTHLAHFFDGGDDLREVVVPFIKAGLDNNEQCLWVTGRAFGAEDARSALRAAVPDLDRRERAHQIEIVDGEQWYSATQKIRPRELVDQLLQREAEALSRGYAGQRTSGNCAWVAPEQWADFVDYERLVQETVASRRFICLCSYCGPQLSDGAQFEVLGAHDFAVRGERALRTNAKPRRAASGEGARGALLEMERQQQTFDLAMLASDMGTWRYTLADNICVYDANAQRLYGLTEAAFLHDEAGVREKFHPDDMELMWSRVAKALEPGGDGRYEVEYRVKQLDGSRRWLSAWGLVEFEGEGEDRKPVAIAGASRDLTKLKQAEDLQRLLFNELNHRVKNTVATIQAIAALTLRAAGDLPSARNALDERIRSLAHAHDLLTARDWTNANLADVVAGALAAFPPDQLEIDGPAVEISPKAALAFALSLHELGTNAAKYGALTQPEGRVSVRWAVQDDGLTLDWEERGGPPVSPPGRRGFGSRLLGQLLPRDLGGETTIDHAPSGVRCRITARL